MVTNTEEKIKSLQSEISEISRFHCEFHYQGSYEYFNIGCGYLKLGMLSDAISCFNKSIEVYRENADSYYARGFAKHLLKEGSSHEDFQISFKYRNVHQDLYIDNHMNYVPYNQLSGIDSFNFSHRKNEKTTYVPLKGRQINILYEHADIAINAKNFADFVDIYKTIIHTTSNVHFEYHVNLANKNFALAQAYEDNGQLSEACFFADKALETDEKNPHNMAYQNLISACKMKINEQIVNT